MEIIIRKDKLRMWMRGVEEDKLRLWLSGLENKDDLFSWIRKTQQRDKTIITPLEMNLFDLKDAIYDPSTENFMFTGQEDILEKYEAYRKTDLRVDADSQLYTMVLFWQYLPFVQEGGWMPALQPDEKSETCDARTGEKNRIIQTNRDGLKFELFRESRDSDAAYTLRGDTMCSVATTLRQFRFRFGKKADIPKWFLDMIQVYHTIGNMILLPYVQGGSVNSSRGIGPSHDYFDLFLLAIYNYCNGINGENEWTLHRALLHNECAVDCMKQYISELNTDPEHTLWDQFIEKNYLQDWVKEKDDGGYGKPYPLWKDHFQSGSVFPKTPEEFEEFSVRSYNLTVCRGLRLMYY
ncbi:MAG: hypothetical protein IJM27_02585 [Eubacterium sp.]|nr:hypothetical protein [Eubacterium sp.]